MKALFFSLYLLTSASQLVAEPIIYAISSGENYEKETWHSVATIEAFEKINETAEIFDCYSIKEEKEGAKIVNRTYSTPSGDWSYSFEYRYNAKGELIKIISTFFTFNGYDSETFDFSSTQCERVMELNDKGEFVKTSENITDPNTKKPVKRTFWEPEVKHWSHISELPQPAKTKK